MKMTSAIRSRTISEPGRSVSTSRVMNCMFSRNDGPPCSDHSDDRWQDREDLPRKRIVEYEAGGDEARLRALRTEFELHDGAAGVALRDFIELHGGAAWMVAQRVRVSERQDREIATGERDVWLVRIVYTEPRAAAHHVVETDAALPTRQRHAPRGAPNRESPAGLLQTNRGENRA